MFSLLKKYFWFFTALLSTLVLAVYFFSVHAVDPEEETARLNESFLKLEKEVYAELDRTEQELKRFGIEKQWSLIDDQSEVFTHIYSNDSLKFWSSNRLPIIRFADIHFPVDGIVHLQNGWYFARTREVDDFLIVSSVLIKADYAYENKDLINGFSPDLEMHLNATIGIDEMAGYPVLDKNGNYIFSVVPNEIQNIPETSSLTLLLLLLFSILSFLMGLNKLVQKRGVFYPLIIIIGVIVIRFASLQLEWFSVFEDDYSFSARIYGRSWWSPDIAAYFINGICIAFVLHALYHLIDKSKKLPLSKWLFPLFLILTIGVWHLLLLFIKDLVDNSTIPLSVDELFSVNTYSILALLIWGVLFFLYFRLVQLLTRVTLKLGWNPARLAVVLFIISCAYLLYDLNYGSELILGAMLPMMVLGSAFFFSLQNTERSSMERGLILLFIYTVVLSAVLKDLNYKKEHEERKVYADELATEKNILTEFEYNKLSPELSQDKYLRRFIEKPGTIGRSDFQENIERRYFSTYWERYDLNFDLIDTNGRSVLEKDLKASDLQTRVEKIIERSAKRSDIDSNLYYVADYSGQFNYLIDQPIVNGDTVVGALICTLQSKKIPEEIGFPRLLISKDADVLEPLERYSIAKYHKNELVTKYGDFSFPSALSVMTNEGMGNEKFFDYGEYEHYYYQRSADDVVVLSKKVETFYDWLTSFSYLFSFYGILLFPLSFRGNGQRDRRTLNLAMRIQLVLVALVFVSLLAFGWSSGVFVRSQYNTYTNDVISEKLRSVGTEVKAKLGSFDALKIDENGDYMQYILQKFSRVFFTDINLYDGDGYLLATSKPKMFNMGLVSEQINPEAYRNLKMGKKSEYVHQENIGKLNFSSAYRPFYNNEGRQLAYINLQHFGQQTELEGQIEQFLVAIVNVFILLLALSILLAIVVSNWLTSPLRVLQNSFTNIRFGKHNEPIMYDKDDEIGDLVKEYNQKLEELEFTAEQLARSERETAWREMAKQVAHEIKNPLTPMKLSVQQLLRTYDPQDERSQEKLQKVANSIVEQIDALTRIANEFSNFAKMPRPNESTVDIKEVVRNVIAVFSSEERVEIQLDVCDEDTEIKGDKDQLMRIMNNLIKNSIQAIPQEKTGRINVGIRRESDLVKITVSDNGVGIPEEKIGKIFLPYFTTKSTGTGLGLAMVKQIVENHGGTIDFESKVGEGTTFYIELPQNK